MSNIDIHATSNLQGSASFPAEKLRISEDHFESTLYVFTGQQGDHIVGIVPSLNVSGYGPDENTAIASLKENLETFLEDLLSLPETEMHSELSKLGWLHEVFEREEMVKSAINPEQILQNFDFPDQVKTSILQAA